MKIMTPSPTTSISPFSLLVPNKFLTIITNRNVMITPRRRRSLRVCASSSNKDSYDGKQVDESMIVLRLRIRDIEMKKMKEEEEIEEGGHWWRIMDWERRYWRNNYASDIYHVVGLFQTLLMETRPCVAFGILLVLFFTLSFSMSFSFLHLVDLGKYIFMSH